MEDKNIAVIYGSDSGATKKIADTIANQLSVQALDISDADIDELENFDLLILGTPTVNNGELQSDWDYVLDEVEDLDLSHTRVALFGLGNQVEYAESFVDAMANIADAVEEAGAKLIGRWPIEGYKHSNSRAQEGEFFLGLALDMDTQPALTPQRIELWLEQLRQEC